MSVDGNKMKPDYVLFKNLLICDGCGKVHRCKVDLLEAPDGSFYARGRNRALGIVKEHTWGNLMFICNTCLEKINDPKPTPARAKKNRDRG